MNFKLALIIVLLLCAPWLINAYKLTQCDFESDYKCEILHGAGLVLPPFSFITVWFSAD